jgi:predicted MFS family arabinose efflux permease
VFGINILPIAVTLLLLRGLPAESARSGRTRIDWTGAALGVVGLGFPVFALIEHPRLGWGSPAIIASLVLGAAGLIAFVLWERRSAQPMLPLAIFRERDFSVGNIATAFIYGGVAVGTFALSLFLQQGAGYSATMAGFAMVPSSIVLIALSAFFGRLSGRVGPRVMMTVGPLVAAAGFALMLRIGTDADYLTEVLPAVAVFGLGMSITVAPLTATILGAVDASRSGIASAVNNAVSRIAGLVTIALAGSVGGATLDAGGFHDLAGAAAIAVAVGGVVSALGIRNPRAITVRHTASQPHPLPGLSVWTGRWTARRRTDG